MRLSRRWSPRPLPWVSVASQPQVVCWNPASHEATGHQRSPGRLWPGQHEQALKVGQHEQVGFWPSFLEVMLSAEHRGLSVASPIKVSQLIELEPIKLEPQNEN